MSRYVVLHKKVMYKDHLHKKKQEKENVEYTMIDEIIEKKFQRY